MNIPISNDLNELSINSPPIQVLYIIVKPNAESQKRANAKYYIKNKDKIMKRQVARATERYNNDPEFKEKTLIRMREASRRKALKTLRSEFIENHISK